VLLRCCLATKAAVIAILICALPSIPCGAHDLTAQDLNTFLDGLVPYGMQRGNIAGGVVVVVKDGSIFVARGYGYADVASHKPVDPARTLFRVGSISKLFTWTSVMQLVQAGRLSLDRDINDYLDFKIPPKFNQPITLRNLMTHTPGFEDHLSGSSANEPRQLLPLRDYLANNIPARIFPPGEVVAYSNYGAALAGYIVQRISGQPFAAYLATHIFEPLAMDHSTLAQPLPGALQPDMASGYLQATDEKPWPFELINDTPAGAVTASGLDMAHFMMAHLQHGSYQGAQILSPQVTQLMHTPQSTMAPGMNGFDLGFIQENRNGLRIIGHSGDLVAFHSDLHLILDRNIGVFVSFNSLGKEAASVYLREVIFNAFLDRYFPYSGPEERTVADPGVDARRVAGSYAGSRRNDAGLRLASTFSQSMVTARADGTIEVSSLLDPSGTPKRWREVGPLTYREVGGQSRLEFVTNARAEIDYWVTDDDAPIQIYQRVHGLRQSSLLGPVMATFLGALLLTVTIWFGGGSPAVVPGVPLHSQPVRGYCVRPHAPARWPCWSWRSAGCFSSCASPPWRRLSQTSAVGQSAPG
jgi:CubicO group peptidase (beta-lactamase class C family)